MNWRTVTLGIVASLILGLAPGCSDDGDTDADGAVDLGPFKNDLFVKPDKTLPDVGTPDVDVSKLPKIISMIPDNGFANGGKSGSGTPVLLSGQNFAQGAVVYIDGKPQALVVTVTSPVSLAFKMPKNPYGPDSKGEYPPQRVNVSILVKSQMSNIVSFTYHKTKAMSSDFKGVVSTSSVSSYADFTSDAFTAKVYYKGLTDTETSESKKLRAEIGYGTKGVDPTDTPGWKWFKATFKEQDSSGYHVFTGTLKVPLPQTYDVAFRFSYDQYGLGDFKEYIYADTDETNLKYEAAKAAAIVASKAPNGYCQSNTDCLTQGFNQTCKIDSSNPKNNKCVQCLADSDCTRFAGSLGPYCNTSTLYCYCKSDNDCKNKQTGYKCHTKFKSPYCGCTKDAECPTGMQCETQQTYMCM